MQAWLIKRGNKKFKFICIHKRKYDNISSNKLKVSDVLVFPTTSSSQINAIIDQTKQYKIALKNK